LLVAVMQRSGGATHETLSPRETVGWSCLLIHGLPAGSGAMRVLLSCRR
jgi:hypothetical protein